MRNRYSLASKNRYRFSILLILLSIFSVFTFFNIEIANITNNNTLDSIDNPIHQHFKENSTLNYANFNKTTAFEHIESQVNFGYRIPGTFAHNECIAWISNQIESYGEVMMIPFTVHGIMCQNILLKINPGQETIFSFGAHFDTRVVAEKDPNPELKNIPIAGANDGGSGVAVLIEMARVLAQQAELLNHEYWFLFIDAEDQGNINSGEFESWDWCEGSQWFANQLQNNPSDYFLPTQSLANLAGFILLDMVGGPNLRFIHESHNDLRLEETIFSIGRQLGYESVFPSSIVRYSITDDHVYLGRIGIPVLDLVIKFWDSSNGWPYHHTQNDTIANIDPNSLEITGFTVLYYILECFEIQDGVTNKFSEFWQEKIIGLDFLWKSFWITFNCIISIIALIFLHFKLNNKYMIDK